MTTHIGRIAIPDRPATYDVGAGTISIAGRVFADSLLEAEHVRTQITRLVGNQEEPVVPIIVEDGFTGFAAITSAQVSAPAGAMAGHWFDYSIEAAPVPNARRPRAVSVISAVPRTNDNEYSGASVFQSVPAGTEQWSFYPTHGSWPTVTDPPYAVTEERSTAPGPAAGGVRYRRAAQKLSAGFGQLLPPWDTTARWTSSPELWYGGSCAAEVRRAGRWLPVVGRQELPSPWRITNGLVELTLLDDPNGSNTGRLRVSWWRHDGAGWCQPIYFGFGYAGVFDIPGWRVVEVTSLSAERVVIRALAARDQGRTTLWLTLERGSRVISGVIDTDSLPAHRVGPKPGVAVTTTAPLPNENQYTRTTGDVDPSGLRLVLASPRSFDVNGSTGEVKPVSALNLLATWPFSIGAYFNGLTGDSGSHAAVAEEIYSSRIEAVRVG